MNIDKVEILSQLRLEVESELEKLKDAYKHTRSSANSDDMKAESKWDTRATEAKYLAEGKKKRIDELEEELQLLDQVSTKNYSEKDEVEMGALIELECSSQRRFYYLSSTGGGRILSFNNTPVMIITVFSPIGSEVLGLNVGDIFELETPKDIKEYKIVSLC